MFEIKELIVPGQKSRPKEPAVNALPEPVPRPYQGAAFRMMIVGPSGVGKSNVFVNLLVRAYNNVFTNVYIFCPTFFNDSTLIKLVTPGQDTGESFLTQDDIFVESDAKLIAERVDEIKKHIDEQFALYEKDKPGEPLPKTLMVFDDLTNEIYNAPFLKNLFTKGRKHEISIIIITNKYRVYNPQIRNNCTHFIFFKPTTKKESNDIAEDISSDVDPARIEAVMQTVYKAADHPFLFYDKNSPNKKFWFKFQKPINV